VLPRLRNRVHVFTTHGSVGILAPRLQHFLGWPCWNQAVAAAADQVLPARLFQRLAALEVGLRFEELQQCPLRFPVT